MLFLVTSEQTVRENLSFNGQRGKRTPHYKHSEKWCCKPVTAGIQLSACMHMLKICTIPGLIPKRGYTVLRPSRVCRADAHRNTRNKIIAAKLQQEKSQKAKKPRQAVRQYSQQLIDNRKSFYRHSHRETCLSHRETRLSPRSRAS